MKTYSKEKCLKHCETSKKNIGQVWRNGGSTCEKKVEKEICFAINHPKNTPGYYVFPIQSEPCMLSWKEQRGNWCKFSRAIHYCLKHGNESKTLVTSHLEHSTSLVSLYIIENSFKTESKKFHRQLYVFWIKNDQIYIYLLIGSPVSASKIFLFSRQLRLKIFSLKSPPTSPSPAKSKEGQVEQRDTAYENYLTPREKVDLFHPSKLIESFNHIMLKGLLQNKILNEPVCRKR